MRNGISQTEFRRLIFTVLTVIAFYFPFSIYVFVLFLEIPMFPFSWDRIHGPLWGVIVKVAGTSAMPTAWIGPALAFTSFLFIGTTRNARSFYERCVEWLYDHAPSKLQSKLTGMRKVSQTCKERRSAGHTLTGLNGTNISIIQTNSGGRRAVKNWFDSDDDADEKSMHSSDATLTGRDEEEGYAAKDFKGTKSEVSAYSGQTSWTAGVNVTREVVVETSSR